MWPNPEKTADLVTFTEEILNEKLHFSSSAGSEITVWNLDTVGGATHSICNLRCKAPRKILVVVHDISHYDYHFQRVRRKCESQLECPREKIEKYITTSSTIKRENENDNTLTCKIIFLYSIRFMSSSLSCLANNRTKGLYKNKFKDCRSDLEYDIAEECIDCNKNFEKRNW